jgi:hypothetical protein
MFDRFADQRIELLGGMYEPKAIEALAGGIEVNGGGSGSPAHQSSIEIDDLFKPDYFDG